MYTCLNKALVVQRQPCVPQPLRRPAAGAPDRFRKRNLSLSAYVCIQNRDRGVHGGVTWRVQDYVLVLNGEGILVNLFSVFGIMKIFSF